MLKITQFLLLSVLLILPAHAQEGEIGSVTNLPLPRFVSMKANEGYARRGPSQSHRIDWVFKHKNTPLMITAEYEHWRRVQDVDGQGGWMHFRLLSGVRTVVIKQADTILYRRPDLRAGLVAKAEQGVIGRLDDCRIDWCKIIVGRNRGWVEKTAIWGVFEDEIRP